MKHPRRLLGQSNRLYRRTHTHTHVYKYKINHNSVVFEESQKEGRRVKMRKKSHKEKIKKLRTKKKKKNTKGKTTSTGDEGRRMLYNLRSQPAELSAHGEERGGGADLVEDR